MVEAKMEALSLDDKWRTNTTYEERIQHLYSTSLFSDIVFNVIDDSGTRIFKVHSTILCIASPVFERMFFNEHFDRSRDVIIDDVESEFFDLFLKFLYKIKVDLTSVEEAWSLYYLGEKYMVPELKDLCLPYILNSIKPETACTSYEMAQMYDLKDLTDNCFEFLIDYTDKVVNDPSFLSASTRTIFTLLDQKKLNIREVDLLVAVVNWATHRKSELDENVDEENRELTKTKTQKQKRCYLIKKILANIYFMDISPDEFACKVRGIDVLTSDESLSIIVRLVSKDAKEWPKGFRKCKRENKENTSEYEMYKVVFDKEGSESATQDKWTMSVLKVNSPIIIVAFEISCGENPSDPTGSYEEKSQVVILNSDTGAGCTVNIDQSVVYGSKLRVDLQPPFPAFTEVSYQIGIITDVSSFPRQTVKLDDCRFEEEDVLFSIFASTSPSNTPLTGIYFVKAYDMID